MSIIKLSITKLLTKQSRIPIAGWHIEYCVAKPNDVKIWNLEKCVSNQNNGNHSASEDQCDLCGQRRVVNMDRK